MWWRTIRPHRSWRMFSTWSMLQPIGSRHPVVTTDEPLDVTATFRPHLVENTPWPSPDRRGGRLYCARSRGAHVEAVRYWVRSRANRLYFHTRMGSFGKKHSCRIRSA